jgi:hypothetical protein
MTSRKAGTTMSYCQSSQNSDGEHRWEWVREEHGIIWYVCVNANCGETDLQFIDAQGG